MRLLLSVFALVVIAILLVALFHGDGPSGPGGSQDIPAPMPPLESEATDDLGAPQEGSRRPAADTSIELDQNSDGMSSKATPLEAAHDELATQINDSLDGYLYINHLLDQVLAFAELPISETVDFEYKRDKVIAYPILGLPEGTTGHFLVGGKSYVRDGKDLNYFQIEIEMDRGKREFHCDALREGPRMHLTLDYDEEGKPARMALITERRISLSHSLDEGIDAYHGRFTSGAGYSVDLSDIHKPTSYTYGIIDGQYLDQDVFQGTMPLYGDLDLDPAKVEALLGKFSQHYDKLRNRD